MCKNEIKCDHFLSQLQKQTLFLRFATLNGLENIIFLNLDFSHIPKMVTNKQFFQPDVMWKHKCCHFYYFHPVKMLRALNLNILLRIKWVPQIFSEYEFPLTWRYTFHAFPTHAFYLLFVYSQHATISTTILGFWVGAITRSRFRAIYTTNTPFWPNCIISTDH